MKTQKNTIKILIVGLGGVGGFYGGLLAKQFEESDAVQICFLARGAHLKAIQEKGLSVYNKEEHFVAKPFIASSNTSEIGVVDYIFLCTKDYDLENTLQQIQPCIGAETVLIPLLNGVKAFEEIEKAFPTHEVWKGCTYIVSRLVAPGIIENKSGRQRIVFGLDSGLTTRMLEFEKLLKASGIRATATAVITTEIWEKYILVSTSATATTYFNVTIGQVMNEHATAIQLLLEEAVSLARAKGVVLESTIVNTITDRLKAIPGDSTTSMHSDYLAGKDSTELNIMTGYFVKEASLYGLTLPTYTLMLQSLQDRKGAAYLGL